MEAFTITKSKIKSKGMNAIINGQAKNQTLKKLKFQHIRCYPAL
jgi:hypothetical protein